MTQASLSQPLFAALGIAPHQEDRAESEGQDGVAAEDGATAWIREADQAWASRLDRLKTTVESTNRS